VLDIGNFFAIKEAKKGAKDGTGSSSGDKNLLFMTVMIDGDGAGGVDGDVVRNVVKMEISGGGWRGCGGWRGSKWEEVRYGEVSKEVVEEFGDVGVAGGDEGGGEVNVGITGMEFAVNGFAIHLAEDNSTNCERGDPGEVGSNRPRGGVSALMSRKRSRSSRPRGCGVCGGGSGGARSWSGGTTGGTEVGERPLEDGLGLGPVVRGRLEQRRGPEAGTWSTLRHRRCCRRQRRGHP
jgi:hypothetical protein